jgi:ATP diphosphatase
MDSSVLDQISEDVSLLGYSLAIQKCAAKLGFDWPDVMAIFAKLQEEVEELQQEITELPETNRLHDELGDMLFCCVNIARHLNVDPEKALRQANQKFCKRFRRIEHLLEEQNTTLHIDALLELWEVAKSQVG